MLLRFVLEAKEESRAVRIEQKHSPSSKKGEGLHLFRCVPHAIILSFRTQNVEAYYDLDVLSTKRRRHKHDTPDPTTQCSLRQALVAFIAS